jgi:hypothetical protein
MLLDDCTARVTRRVVIHGESTVDLFAGLMQLLKSIVRVKLAPDGILNLDTLTSDDVVVLKQEMLQFGVRLNIAHGVQLDVPHMPKELRDHRLIMRTERELIMIWFDYARVVDEPRPLE